MKNNILYIFTRTPLHVGAGHSVGAIDQPIQRERHTAFPIIPGSSLKGVLRDHFIGRKELEVDAIFHQLFGIAESNKLGQEGESLPESAGTLSFSEAKLVLFPLRSAKGGFAWATCPLALGRYKRDAGLALPLPTSPDDGHCCAGTKLAFDTNGRKAVVLEEFTFACQSDFPQEWADHFASLLEDSVLAQAKTRLILLSDGDFAHFALNACVVNHHNRIDPLTGTVADGALFNEECVPSETFFYSQVNVLARGSQNNPLFEALKQETLLQFGGNGTTGLGFCTTKLSQGL